MKTKTTITAAVLLLTLSFSFGFEDHTYRMDRGLSAGLPGEKAMFCGIIHELYKKTKDPVKIVDLLYQQMFPGSLGSGVKVQFSNEGSRNGAIGVTTIFSSRHPNYTPIGSGSDPIDKVEIEVLNTSDWDTTFHELSHSFNASIRKNMGGYDFFDEGMAVFTSWCLHNSKMEKDALSLKKLVEDNGTPFRLKTYFLDLFDKEPSASQYTSAGFFMVQIYDLAGPSTVKYLITVDSANNSPEKVYKRLLEDLKVGPHGSLDEDGFWLKMSERLEEWSK